MKVIEVRENLVNEKKDSYWWLVGLSVFVICLILVLLTKIDKRALITFAIFGFILLCWDIYRDVMKNFKKEISQKGVLNVK